MIKRAFCLFTLFFLIACNETAIESDIKPIPVPLDAPISSGKLGGLFTDGGGHTPVILIIPGSGPTDKDGNSGRRFQSNSYKFLAYQLAQNGISTVRVDKRGMFSSETAGDGNAVSIEIYAKDYRNWVKTILAKTGQPCVYLMGHSEGGLMAIATARGENNICGLILLATPGQKLGDVLRNQLRANPANTPILQKAEESIGKLEAGETVDTTEMHPALQGLFRPQVQSFLMSVLPADPAMLLSELSLPVLIIQGDNDLQVSTEDAKRLLNNSQNGEILILSDVNHVLKLASKDRAGNISSYNSPDRPIDDRIVPAIQGFIHQQN